MGLISYINLPRWENDFVVSSQITTLNQVKEECSHMKGETIVLEASPGCSHMTGEIIVLGGFCIQFVRTSIPVKSIDKYHSDENEWKHYGDLPEYRLHFSLTIQNGKVYLAGGFDLRLKVKPPVPTADAFL